MILPTIFVVMLGALTQRLTGLGFALIASPLLVLLVGPYQGVILANLLALLVAASVLAAQWREIEWAKVAVLTPAGLVGVLPGVYLARQLPEAPLQAVIGFLGAAGLVATLAVAGRRLPGGPAVSATAGVASGFMTATAGIGGPALTVYAVATGWRHSSFTATAQISFGSQAVLAVGLKGVSHLPEPMTLLALIGSVGAGMTLGHLLADRVTPARARTAMIAIALCGALATMGKGLLALP